MIPNSVRCLIGIAVYPTARRSRGYVQWAKPFRPSLVTPRPVLGFPELVHLGHPLLELDVLALFVRMSLVLRLVLVSLSSPLSAGQLGLVYLALPREVVRLVATPVEGDQEVGAAVAVCHGQLGRRHFLARRFCELSLEKLIAGGSERLVRRGVVASDPSAIVEYAIEARLGGDNRN
jgi:hypothetical protein